MKKLILALGLILSTGLFIICVDFLIIYISKLTGKKISNQKLKKIYILFLVVLATASVQLFDFSNTRIGIHWSYGVLVSYAFIAVASYFFGYLYFKRIYKTATAKEVKSVSLVIAVLTVLILIIFNIVDKMH